MDSAAAAQVRVECPMVGPYPAACFATARLASGEKVIVRPIHPGDEPQMVRFHAGLSEESVYLRYAGLMKLDGRVAHQRLARICAIEPRKEMALVVERLARDDAPSELIAVGRLEREPGTLQVEFALLVSDAWQRQGLGTLLLTRLIEVARGWGMKQITAEIVPRNEPMKHLCRQLGFKLQYRELIHAVREL